MTEGAWLSIVGMVVTVALGAAACVFGLIGWLLSRMIAANDREIRELKDSNVKLWAKATRFEVLMEEHRWIPRRVKFPSPPSQIEEGSA